MYVGTPAWPQSRREVGRGRFGGHSQPFFTYPVCKSPAGPQSRRKVGRGWFGGIHSHFSPILCVSPLLGLSQGKRWAGVGVGDQAQLFTPVVCVVQLLSLRQSRRWGGGELREMRFGISHLSCVCASPCWASFMAGGGAGPASSITFSFLARSIGFFVCNKQCVTKHLTPSL